MSRDERLAKLDSHLREGPMKKSKFSEAQIVATTKAAAVPAVA